MYLFYQIILIFILVITGPYFLIRAIAGGHGIKERLGFWKFSGDDRQVVWFHAASMGELKAINNILPELLKIKSDTRIVISTITKTGKNEAIRLFKPVEVFYLPIDLRCCVRRVIRRVKPSLLVLVETELWPVLISRTAKSGAKIAVINGRLSLKSFKFYRFFKSLFSPAIGKINLVMAQTDDNAERFVAMGASKERVLTAGNIKFDQVLNQGFNPPDKELLAYLNHADRFIFIAGSIWPGEFEVILESAKKLLNVSKTARVILAPRHMKNLSKLEEDLNRHNIQYIKRSKISESQAKSNVMILDTMGELRGLYRYANLAYVGGSLVTVGGHDPLEPASSSCPVCFGPHMENSKSFTEILVKAGGAFYISSDEELTSLMLKLASDPAQAKTIGQRAYQAVLAHSGVSKIIAAKLAELL